MSETTAVTAAGWLARHIVRLYPHAWRERYAAEALNLLELRAPSWGDVANLAYHALYTRLHPDLLGEGSEPAYGTLAGLLRGVWSYDVATVWTFGVAMRAWAWRARPGVGTTGAPKERP